MSETRIVITGEDQTKAAVDSAKRNIQELQQQTGMSAKAMAAAMREVPPQITDIVVGLQGGQRPLTVLLQQGGQLKDMFGGVLPAAKALGNYLMTLVNPVTLMAGAVGLVAYAYQQAAEENGQLNKVIILTGGYAGYTAGQLNAMSKEMAKSANVTRSDAVDSLVQLIATGRIAAPQLREVGIAAVDMAKAMDRPLKDIVADFVLLGDEPAKASAKLNEQYHFLTQSVYEHIQALEEQGRKDQAAALAQHTFAQEAIERNQRLKDSLGGLEKAWNSVAGAAKSAWEALKNAVSPDQSPEGRLDQLARKISKAQRPFDPDPYVGNAAERAQLPLLQQQYADNFRRAEIGSSNAYNSATNAKEQQAAIAASERVQQLQDQAKGVSAITRELKKYHDQLAAIRAVNPNSAFLDPKAVKAGEKAIRDQFKGDSLTKADQAIDAKIKALQGKFDAEERGVKQTLDTLKTDYELGLTNAKQYLDKSYEAKQASLEREFAIAKQQETLARGKQNVAAAEQYKNEQKKILDEIATNFIEHANSVSLLSAKARRAVDAYLESLSAQYRTRQGEIDDTLAGAGMGARAQAQQQALNAVRREYDQKAEDLRRQLQKGEANGGISQEVYDRELRGLQDYYQKRLGQEQDYNAKSNALRGDWTMGAKQAFADYAEGASDVAGQTKQVFTDAFQGMEDALVSFATTGKLNFRNLANTIIADIARMQAKAAVSKMLSSAGGSGGFLSFLGLGGGSSGPGAGFSSDADLASYVSSISAKGNVFQTPGLSEYTNRIVNRPTVFAFARGAGLMGEAGPEAIMPLTRGADGRLGVSAPGGAASRDVNIINHGAPIQSATRRDEPDGSTTVVVDRAHGKTVASMYDPSSDFSKGLLANFEGIRRRR